MPADRHREPPVSFRPPEADRKWLLAYAAETGTPVNALLTEALRAAPDVIAFLRRLVNGRSLAELRADAEIWKNSADLNEAYLAGVSLDAGELLARFAPVASPGGRNG